MSGAPDVRCTDVPYAGSQSPGMAKAVRENHCLTTNIVDVAHSAPGTSATDRAPFHGPLLKFTAQLRQPLFTSLKMESAVRAARAGVASEAETVRGVDLDAALAAVQLYAHVKTARGTLGALDRAIGSLDRFLAAVESELDGKNAAGFVEADSLRLRIQIENLKVMRADARRSFEAGAAALRAITGDDEAALDDDDLESPPLPPEDPSAWRARMENDLPELRSANAGIGYYGQLVRVQRGFMLPDLVLVTGVTVGYAPSFDTPSLGFANLPVSAPSALIAAVLHQPLTIGPGFARTAQAQHEERRQLARLALGRGKWALDVDKAWLDLEEATRRRDELEHGLRVVEGWYASVDQQLALGLRTDGRELTEVVINWANMETRALQARGDAVVALALLRRASGQAVAP